jgi:MFS family permease
VNWKPDWSKLVIYLVIPAVLTGGMAAMYFSGDPVAQRLVAPKLPPLDSHSWREFGLLENGQTLLLAVMVATLAAGAWRARAWRVRAGFVLAALFALFILLEEIDYGKHWREYAGCEESIEWFRPVPHGEWNPLEEKKAQGASFTVHQRHLTTEFKVVGDVLLIALFVVLPLAAPRVRNRWVRWAAPSRYAVLTVIAMLLTSQAVHTVGRSLRHRYRDEVRRGEAPQWELGSLVNNLSEFREFNAYYLYAVYFAVLVFGRRLPGAADANEPARGAGSQGE